ncbi:hypothetical protein Anas_13871 [Armadillidium nasatum]|uniref:Uncharacterized protein n=1 Tax=Armadillidium nasatum TaxID=96803 RepID=A0A5N5T453_9CRUS|nr:hypothetical protein Anas_13871 [Armadillidium nasatum]
MKGILTILKVIEFHAVIEELGNISKQVLSAVSEMLMVEFQKRYFILASGCSESQKVKGLLIVMAWATRPKNDCEWKRDRVKAQFSPRDLKAFAVNPIILKPTHFGGQEGYITDTATAPHVSHLTQDDFIQMKLNARLSKEEL